MSKYIPDGIGGIFDKIKKGHNTRKGTPRNHVYKILIGGHKYYKFQLKREDMGSLVRYFKRKKDANAYREILRKTKSLRLADMFRDYKKEELRK